MPLYGKTPGNFHFKKIDGSLGAWLSRDYLLVMDSVKNIYRFDLEGKKPKQQTDKLIAMELC